MNLLLFDFPFPWNVSHRTHAKDQGRDYTLYLRVSASFKRLNLITGYIEHFPLKIKYYASSSNSAFLNKTRLTFCSRLLRNYTCSRYFSFKL